MSINIVKHNLAGQMANHFIEVLKEKQSPNAEEFYKSEWNRIYIAQRYAMDYSPELMSPSLRKNWGPMEENPKTRMTFELQESEYVDNTVTPHDLEMGILQAIANSE